MCVCVRVVLQTSSQHIDCKSFAYTTIIQWFTEAFYYVLNMNYYEFFIIMMFLCSGDLIY